MTKICFSINGYAHLYRSLLRFCNMRRAEALELVWRLNTANLDSYRLAHPNTRVAESSARAFCLRVNGIYKRPYRTEVQFYKSMLALYRNIDSAALTGEQRESVSKLRAILHDTEERFWRAFGMEIDDRKTVYMDCAYSLYTNEWEPAACLTGKGA